MAKSFSIYLYEIFLFRLCRGTVTILPASSHEEYISRKSYGIKYV